MVMLFIAVFFAGFLVGAIVPMLLGNAGLIAKPNLELWERRRQWRESKPAEKMPQRELGHDPKPTVGTNR